jgi:hypothetical protein
MLQELDTPGWQKAFENPEVVKADISREDVVEIVGTGAITPNHETQGGCELFCGTAYLGLFKLRSGRAALIQAYCDLSAVPGYQIVTLGSSTEELARDAMCPDHRRLIGIQTAEDDELLEAYANA